MAIPSTRRGFLAVLAAATTVALPELCPSALAMQRTPQPKPSPNAPTNPNVPGGLNTHPTDSPDRLPVNTINAAQIGTMVQELYQLALELKQEAEHTNLNNTLPVDFPKRAHEIEKLAKAIRERSRG